MKKQLPLVFMLVLVSGMAFSQTKTKLPVKKAVSALEKLLAGSGLPYNMVNDSLAVIPYGGENIVSYKVLIQSISDLIIVFTDLSEALPGKIDSSKYKYLLQQNNQFDVVKICISGEDNSVNLRADLYKAGTSNVLLKRVIEQVANVTNIIGGDFK
ncbi:MAG: hypothetical protein JWR61_1156 [Ferruginibacter sp.]|uniref:hypothetical protein n=1 Tax=Ferruginibacter sp. TaxID=1940288 RepID=UPI00265A3F4C|nr:hypothetical protein [Ferruginibacter sp.]MDB5276201.1 hypothetical protein [Ferruginibacter sp.]